MTCLKCKDTGVIETGNNDFPCDCTAGDTAVFNDSFHGRRTGAELKRISQLEMSRFDREYEW